MLDLVKILKDCPKGTKLYSILFGEVEFEGVHNGSRTVGYTTRTGRRFDVTREGKMFEDYDGECTLFPSKDQRDWSKFKTPIKKFDYSTLKPFDRVLVRDNDRDMWRCSLFTCFRKDQIVCEVSWQQGIPYNEETKHLAGTTDMPDEKYIWWKK